MYCFNHDLRFIFCNCVTCKFLEVICRQTSCLQYFINTCFSNSIWCLMFKVQRKVVIDWFSFDNTDAYSNKQQHFDLHKDVKIKCYNFNKDLLCIAYSIDCSRIALRDLNMHLSFYFFINMQKCMPTAKRKYCELIIIKNFLKM